MKGRGIFVYANMGNKNGFYARRGELNFDIPTQLKMEIPGNLLGKTKVNHEAVVRKKNSDALKNINMTGVEIGVNEFVPETAAQGVAGEDNALKRAMQESVKNVTILSSDINLNTW